MGVGAIKVLKKLNTRLRHPALRAMPWARTLYNLAYDLFRPRKGIVLQDVLGHQMYVNCEDQWIGPHLLRYGVWEPFGTRVVQSLVKPGMTVVDVGANIGYYTLLCASLVGKRGRVVAFEPDPDNFRLLERNVRLNGCDQVVTVPKAVSSERGTTRLYLDAANRGAPSLRQSNVPVLRGSVEVETVRLDDCLNDSMGTQSVDVLRIDAQGAEWQILTGATKVLDNASLDIVMEFWPVGLQNFGADPQQCLAWLERRGFHFAIIDEGNQRLRPATSRRVLDYCEAMKSQWADVDLLVTRGEVPEPSRTTDPE